MIIFHGSRGIDRKIKLTNIRVEILTSPETHRVTISDPTNVDIGIPHPTETRMDSNPGKTHLLGDAVISIQETPHPTEAIATTLGLEILRPIEITETALDPETPHRIGTPRTLDSPPELLKEVR